ncbi:hypothetical protein F511_25323 [Dorcoceras hygrometricum]|uniref:Uncharacterized protein n=1 Tax=Dorcoceras hygrometricum TaxID=472368 RepID=A0A2Z7BQX7_9LAMI|nr:hypothetical protein F511_25323 [Dorcoceras hygrometricum]
MKNNFAYLLLTADCDDITTDVIIADSRSCASIQQLISSTSKHCSCLLTLLLKKTSAEIILLLISLKNSSADSSKECFC